MLPRAPVQFLVSRKKLESHTVDSARMLQNKYLPFRYIPFPWGPLLSVITTKFNIHVMPPTTFKKDTGDLPCNTRSYPCRHSFHFLLLLNGNTNITNFWKAEHAINNMIYGRIGWQRMRNSVIKFAIFFVMAVPSKVIFVIFQCEEVW
jgi:hypothetical protein